MSLNLDIVCHDRSLSPETQSENALRAIGDILPFILAKYGVEPRESPSAPQTGQPQKNKPHRTSPRFTEKVGAWNK